jgi:hypothetical protein
MRFGDDPFIKVIDRLQDDVRFSAWAYAEERCAVMCRKQQGAG